MRRALALAVTLATLASLGACQRHARPAPAPASAAEAPPLTHAPADHPVDFVADQRVEATFRGRAVSARVVIEKIGDRLTLVGLAPFGARVFSAVQDGLEVSARVELEGEPTFPPSLVVADVHRTFLAGFPAPEGTVRDGRRAFTAGGDAFEDVVAAGRVVERRVAPASPDDEALAIRYEPEGMALDGTPPGRVVVRHVRSGLELVITTASYRRLPSR